MDTLPIELLQWIGRLSMQSNMSFFAATFSWISESVWPALFESITIDTTISSQYDLKLALSESILRLLVQDVYFYFTPICDIFQWKTILIFFICMWNIVLSMNRWNKQRQVEGDNIHHFYNLVPGISSLSTIWSLYVYGGNMPYIFSSVSFSYRIPSTPQNGSLPPSWGT